MEDNHLAGMKWIGEAKNIIKDGEGLSSSSKKDDLLNHLARIQVIDLYWCNYFFKVKIEHECLYIYMDMKELIKNQEEGATYVHAAVNWGDKALLTTRSDGKDAIAIHCSELQSEWERLVRKLSDAKVQNRVNWKSDNALLHVFFSHIEFSFYVILFDLLRFKLKQLFCNGRTILLHIRSWRSGYLKKKIHCKKCRKRRWMSFFLNFIILCESKIQILLLALNLYILGALFQKSTSSCRSHAKPGRIVLERRRKKSIFEKMQ